MHIYGATESASIFCVSRVVLEYTFKVLSDCHTVKYSPKPPKFVHCHPLAGPNFRGLRCRITDQTLIAGRNPDFWLT